MKNLNKILEAIGYGQWIAIAALIAAGLCFIYLPYFKNRGGSVMWRGYGIVLIALAFVILAHSILSEFLPEYF